MTLKIQITIQEKGKEDAFMEREFDNPEELKEFLESFAKFLSPTELLKEIS